MISILYRLLEDIISINTIISIKSLWKFDRIITKINLFCIKEVLIKNRLS